jgi:hypothetical protein
VIACAWCGLVPPDTDTPPLTWTSSVEDGALRWYCEACARQNLRAIEARLDRDWW